MADGGWKVNSQPIAFDTAGRLVDGQHRLLAIVRSGITVRMAIAFKVQHDAVKTIDRGRVRTVGEVLRRDGAIPSPTRVTQWSNAHRLLVDRAMPAGSVDNTESYYLTHQKSVEWALSVMPKKGPFCLSVIGSALVIAHEKFPTETEEFFASVIDGEGLRKGSPVYEFRECCVNSHNGRCGGAARVFGVKALRAIQAHVNGERLGKLIAAESSLEFFTAKEST
jgi:hypothetical protein